MSFLQENSEVILSLIMLNILKQKSYTSTAVNNVITTYHKNVMSNNFRLFASIAWTPVTCEQLFLLSENISSARNKSHCHQQMLISSV